jgi:hypothetical protein
MGEERCREYISAACIIKLSEQHFCNKIHYLVLQLMETNSQLWYIIREYISSAEVIMYL